MRHKVTPGHDEAVSYILATCHADDYERVVAERSYPYGVAAPAEAWQGFWAVDRRLCFSSIARGLANTDIHPPLYFWVLHVWSLMAGVGLSQAVWLNVFLVMLTAGALFGLGREALADDVDAGLLAAIWVLSRPPSAPPQAGLTRAAGGSDAPSERLAVHCPRFTLGLGAGGPARDRPQLREGT